MYAVPDDFLHRPFTRAEALASGITRGVLQGRQFLRVYDGVYCHRGHEPSFADRIAAARLALPDGALTTGVTRLQELGIDVGPRSPLHFVVEGDHHLAIDGIFLHRTVKIPPHVGCGVSIEAAFVAFCAESRLLDAITVGSILVNKEMLDLDRLEEILREEKWRNGVPETAYALPHVEGRCRSIPEAKLFSYVVFAGLPVPEVNRPMTVGGIELTPDLWFEHCRLVVEYEGSQHQEERAQYNADIDRYALYRRNDVPYELVTKERMRSPRATVRLVHSALLAEGYAGPPPDFGETWGLLFRPLSELVRRRVPRRR